MQREAGNLRKSVMDICSLQLPNKNPRAGLDTAEQGIS